MLAPCGDLVGTLWRPFWDAFLDVRSEIPFGSDLGAIGEQFGTILEAFGEQLWSLWGVILE